MGVTTSRISTELGTLTVYFPSFSRLPNAGEVANMLNVNVLSLASLPSLTSISTEILPAHCKNQNL